MTRDALSTTSDDRKIKDAVQVVYGSKFRPTEEDNMKSRSAGGGVSINRNGNNRCRHRRQHALFTLIALAVGVAGAGIAGETKVDVDENSFKCILEMTKVDNVLGDLQSTIAVAQAGRGEYPAGSVVQLIPTEVMIKHEKGYSPVTRDWEFFSVDISKDGSKIHSRGAAEVNNRLGLNCFACHVKAKHEFDFICEQTNGCDPIPVTRPMFTALQRSDPRCKDAPELTDEDKQALSDLAEVVKTLTQKQ